MPLSTVTKNKLKVYFEIRGTIFDNNSPKCLMNEPSCDQSKAKTY